jgi:hypothetical protein
MHKGDAFLSIGRGRNMKKTYPAAALTLVGLLSMGTANADTEFAFSGFGTLGWTHSNNDGADYAASLYAPKGVGRTHSSGMSVDTKAGVQGAVNFGNGLSGVLQVVSDYRADNSYRPQFEWANLKYQATQDTFVRLGRVVAPIFVVSEYRNVGYAQTPTRQPWDVYSLNPINHIDGINVGTRFEVGGGTLSAGLTGGHVKDKLNAARVDGPATIGNLNYENGASTFHFGYSKFKLDLALEGSQSTPTELYQSLVPTVGPMIGYPVANTRFKGVDGHILDLSYAYDSDTWLVQSEYAERRADSAVVQDINAWFVLAGYRIGKFTPFASYSRSKTVTSPLSHPPAASPFPGALTMACYGNPMIDPSCPQALQLDGLTQLINGLDTALAGDRITQHTASFGVRYDFHKNMALKFQYDRVFKPGSFATTNGGQFVNTQRSASWMTTDQSVNLITVNLDFVF